MSKGPVVFHLRITPEEPDASDGSDLDPPLRHSSSGSNGCGGINELSMNTVYSVIQNTPIKYGPETCCFWCRHPFEGKPYSQLRSYNIHADAYDAYGYYCSPHCALADMDPTAAYYWDAVSLMQSIWGVFKPAPSWQLLRAYGGALDIRQFRDLLLQPQETRMLAIVENRIYPSFVVTIPSTTTDKAAGGTLRLQRKKTVSDNRVH